MKSLLSQTEPMIWEGVLLGLVCFCCQVTLPLRKEWLRYGDWLFWFSILDQKVYFTGSLNWDHQFLALYPGLFFVVVLFCFSFGLGFTFPKFMFPHVSV